MLMVPTLECHSLVYLDQEVFLSSSWHDAKLDKEAKLLKEFDRVCSLNGSLCLCGS